MLAECQSSIRLAACWRSTLARGTAFKVLASHFALINLESITWTFSPGERKLTRIFTSRATVNSRQGRAISWCMSNPLEEETHDCSWNYNARDYQICVIIYPIRSEEACLFTRNYAIIESLDMCSTCAFRASIWFRYLQFKLMQGKLIRKLMK